MENVFGGCGQESTNLFSLEPKREILFHAQTLVHYNPEKTEITVMVVVWLLTAQNFSVTHFDPQLQ